MAHHFFTLLADAPASGQTSSPLNTLVPLLCVFAIIYFLMIRPQSQRQKQHDALVKAVKTGDKVITSSGIHGMVTNVKETTLIVKIADNVKVELEKSSVGSVVKRDDDEPASAS